MDTASKLILAGDLGCFAAEWSGWIIREHLLISPEGWEISVSDVLAARLKNAQLAVYQAENRRLKEELIEAKVLQLEEQPNPDELGEVLIRIG